MTSCLNDGSRWDRAESTGIMGLGLGDEINYKPTSEEVVVLSGIFRRIYYWGVEKNVSRTKQLTLREKFISRRQKISSFNAQSSDRTSSNSRKSQVAWGVNNNRAYTKPPFNAKQHIVYNQIFYSYTVSTIYSVVNISKGRGKEKKHKYQRFGQS